MRKNISNYIELYAVFERIKPSKPQQECIFIPPEKNIKGEKRDGRTQKR